MRPIKNIDKILEVKHPCRKCSSTYTKNNSYFSKDGKVEIGVICKDCGHRFVVQEFK